MARKDRNDATMRGMWAPIVNNGHSRWVDCTAIRYTRRESKRAYLDGVPEDRHPHMLGCVTFARVTITEDAP